MNNQSNVSKSVHVNVNRGIRAPNVLCINKNNENIGVIPTNKAIKLAEDDGLDLVQVSMTKDKIPTCKIIDYGKYKYEQSKKQKLNEKKQRESIIKCKQIQFRPNTSENDLQIKAKKAADFLNEGCHVKVCVLFKGREQTHSSIVYERFNTFLRIVNDHNLLDGHLAKMIDGPKMESKSLSAQLALIKDTTQTAQAS